MIWTEPVRGEAPEPSFGSLPGLERLRLLLTGEVSAIPLSRLTGIGLTQVGPGHVTGTVPATMWLQTDDALDVTCFAQEIMTATVLTTAPAGHEVIPATFAITHLRLAGVDCGSFIARGRVLHSGPRFTLAEIVIEDARGRGVAHATGSLVVRPIDPAPPPYAPRGQHPPPVYPTPDPYLREFDDKQAFKPQLLDAHPPLAILERMAAGEIPPPVFQLLGMAITEVMEGGCTLTVPCHGWLTSIRPPDIATGVIALLQRFALGMSAYTVTPTGRRIKDLDTSMTYLATVPADGRELRAAGQVVYQFGETVLVNSEVVDADGRVVAAGRQTALLVRPRDRRGPAQDEPDRVLATVLFTDIVGSTRKAEELGDAAWSELLDRHHTLVRHELKTWKGKEVKTLGDGFLATFDSPTRAVQCARAVRDGLRRHGLEIRAGLHTGECEVSPTDVAGIAVHVAARVQAAAEPGEILVSGTVRDLAAGSGLRFNDRGRHELKGIDGEWALYSLAG